MGGGRLGIVGICVYCERVVGAVEFRAVVDFPHFICPAFVPGSGTSSQQVENLRAKLPY